MIELENSLNKLSVNPKPSKSASAFKKKQQSVADSWEDEDSGDETDRPLSSQPSTSYPAAPPPTPSSPSTSFNDWETFTHPFGYGLDGTSDQRSERPNSRPQKTDAVAKRMIAGALGVKSPKPTEEKRAFERAVKEKELRRRDQEKASAARAKEDAERAKTAVWSD